MAYVTDGKSQVPRETVRVLVKELDPDGVRERRAKTLRRRTYHSPGPNYAWHGDGYDKLFFNDLVEAGHLNTSSELEKECLWCCFANLLQEDLTRIKRHWNSHYNRKSRFDTVSGRPDELYFLPECTGAQNYGKEVTDALFQDMSQYCHAFEEEHVIQEYFQTVGDELGLSQPTHNTLEASFSHVPQLT